MLLIKCRLNRLITLNSNEYTVLFTDHIFVNSLYRNTRPSTCFKTHGRAFQTLGRAFQTLGQAFQNLRENQKLGREFEKLGRVFVLQYGPCCPNQPWYTIPVPPVNKIKLTSTISSSHKTLITFLSC